MSVDLSQLDTPVRRSSLESLTPEIARKLAEQIRRRATGQRTNQEGVKAFNRGREARLRGFERVSPYYEKPFLEATWFRGYDELPTVRETA